MLFFVIFPIFAAPGTGAQERQDNYGDIADYLDNIYGLDENAGLTAFPVLNVPMGGHSEGMGTAFTAVCDDISFIEFNPAGSSMLSKSELAFFHNNWIADTMLEGIVYATRFGNLGIGAGAKWMYTPFTEYNLYGERVSNGYYSEGLVILNASYNFLSGYYFSGISAGVNLKGAFRVMPDFTDSEDKIIANSGWEQSAVMGMADVGMLTRFNLFKFYSSRDKNTSVALTMRNLGPPAIDEPLPTVACAAMSYSPLRPILFAFDFYLPVNMIDPDLSEKPYMAFGASVNVTGFLSMHGGIMFKAGSSRLTVGSAVNLDKISIDINYTLDLVTQLQPLNRISLGVRLDLGDGGRKQISDRIDELYLLGLESYSRGDFGEARYYWEETLSLNPRFDPAKEGLAFLNRREALEQRITDVQNLEF